MKEFYRQTVKEVLDRVESSEAGLTSEQADHSREKCGWNELTEGKKKSISQIFFEQYKDFLVLILIVSAVVSLFLGETESAAVILLVIVIFAGSCACGKKTVKAPDAESQGVMKITPIPTATPTPVPRQVNKDAVAQSGSVTMVNEYLVQKEEGKAAGSSKSGSSEEQTAADSSDSGSDATGNSTDEETETGSGD